MPGSQKGLALCGNRMINAATTALRADGPWDFAASIDVSGHRG